MISLRYFPPELVERFRAGILAHRLRREIIATVAANDLVNRAGIAFARELGELTGRGAGRRDARLHDRAPRL